MAVNLRRIRHDRLLAQEELADRSGPSAHSLGLTFRDVGGTHAEPIRISKRDRNAGRLHRD